MCAGYAQTLGSDTASNSPLPDLFKVLLTKTPDGVLVPYSVEGYQPVRSSWSCLVPLGPLIPQHNCPFPFPSLSPRFCIAHDSPCARLSKRCSHRVRLACPSPPNMLIQLHQAVTRHDSFEHPQLHCMLLRWLAGWKPAWPSSACSSSFSNLGQGCDHQHAYPYTNPNGGADRLPFRH